MKEKDRIEIDLVQMLKVLWKRKLIIALAAIISGAIAFGYSSFVIKPGIYKYDTYLCSES